MIGYGLVAVLLLTIKCDGQWLDRERYPSGNAMEHHGHHNEDHNHNHRVWPDFESETKPPDRYPVQYAAVPSSLDVQPLPLPGSDHELMLNISWTPAYNFPARDYSLEVRSVTDTVDCKSALMCYEYNIPGNVVWWLIPEFASPVAESCAVRPGCAYSVQLTAHPWDGKTVAERTVQLHECVSGVCSCAHSPRLPVPVVNATTVVMEEEIFVNVSWSLPMPLFPQRLPRNLNKQSYAVSIGKQMVTDAHPSPWFANTILRHVNTGGPIATGEKTRWILLPTVEVDERSDKQRDQRSTGDRGKKRELDVKLLARVNVVDERGCLGPAGKATAYDPAEEPKVKLGTYILWAAFGGICVLAMVAILAMSTRVVKRILSTFRPASASTPLAPLRQRPAWLALPLRS